MKNISKVSSLFAILIIIFLYGCAVELEENAQTEITAKVINEDEIIEEQDSLEETGLNELPMENEEIGEDFSDKEEDAKIDEIKENLCAEGWSCYDSYQQGFQLSNCSWISISKCNKGCEEGRCIAEDCVIDSLKCDENVLKRCISGMEWVQSEICENGCENNSCITKEIAIDDNTVIEVIDGDEFLLQSGKLVKMIGIDAPDIGQPYYNEAKNRLKKLIENRIADLEKDIEKEDSEGSLLRYVFLHEDNINAVMVEEGYAKVNISGSNTKYRNDLESAWDDCLTKTLNLCSTQEYPEQSPEDPAIQECSNCIAVESVNADPEGNECSNLTSLANEYVVFRNNCDSDCIISNWSVKDDSTGAPYYFPQFTFEKNKLLKLSSGCGTNTNENIFWCSPRYPCKAIWNNNGDKVFLYNKNGNLILEHTY